MPPLIHLLGLTENRNHSNAELTELHLRDDMVELLQSGRINNRLLCEIATHPDFVNLLTLSLIHISGRWKSEGFRPTSEI